MFGLLMSLALALAAHAAAIAQWVQTKGPEGGYICSLAEDDSFFYAATFGPIFRMQKDDATWTPLPQNAYSLAINGTTLVAGTDGGGVARSADRGVTWERWIPLGQAHSVFCFAVNGNDLFAGTDRGVYLSTDNGARWIPKNAGQPASMVASLLVKDSYLFAGFLSSGVYRSTDRGTSWAPAYNGLPTDTTWLWSLAVLDSTLFAGTWWGAAVYRSTDDGMTWNPANYGLLNPDVNTLAVLGTNLFAGTHGGVFVSNNRGDSWTRVANGPPSIVNCLHVSGTEMLGGAMDGVFFSTNTGHTWFPVKAGLIGTLINVFLRDGPALLAGANSGLFRSDDDGANWVKTLQASVTSLVVSGTNLFAGTGIGVCRSTDGGSYWSTPKQVVVGGRITALAVIPGSSHLFAGTDSRGVFLSTNNGNSWAPVNSGLTDTTIRCLAVIDTSLFVGSGSGVFLSADKGASWSLVNTGLTDLPVQCFAASGGNLFAGTDDGGVFLSKDLGTSWTPVNSGLTDPNILCLAARDTRVFAGTWFDGVFLSENSGATWTRVDTGLATFPILALDVDDTNLFAGSRGAGVWRRPLSEMITAVDLSSGGVPSGFRLEQNYPNPFNPTTNIQFTIVNRQLTIVKVYDVLGREVSTLVNEVKDPGTYTVNFDASALVSGVYFYRLQALPTGGVQAGSFVQTRKLLVLR
jgi:ligand-binding sensor domain-containing protein